MISGNKVNINDGTFIQENYSGHISIQKNYIGKQGE
jgi:hypothetical protein